MKIKINKLPFSPYADRKRIKAIIDIDGLLRINDKEQYCIFFLERIHCGDNCPQFEYPIIELCPQEYVDPHTERTKIHFPNIAIKLCQNRIRYFDEIEDHRGKDK